MRSKRSNFEVRCDRCDVTFPIGTRKCIHCGGATTKSTGALWRDQDSVPGIDLESRFGGDDNESVWPTAADPEPVLQESEAPIPRELASPEQTSPSVGRSILGSMGSLVWIALLIAFSLSGRVCGE